MNTVCDRDWPEDFEHENGEYMNTCCECKNTFTGHKRRFFCKACSTSKRGEAVEVVASIAVDAEGVVRDFTLEPGLDRHPGGYTVTPLMSVRQHQRILAAATHPADQVAEAVAWLTSDKRHLVFSGALDQSQYVEQGMTPLYTHPADQVAEGVAVPVQLLKIIEQSWRIPNGCPKSISEEVGEIISNGLAELRALLAKSEGAKK